MQPEKPFHPEASKPNRRKDQPSSANLMEKAGKAVADGRAMFYEEGEGIPVKEGGVLFYNAASSKLSGILQG